MKYSLIAALSAVLFLTLSCEKSPDTPSADTRFPPFPLPKKVDAADSGVLQVLDDRGQPIANARILIGDTPEHPPLITDSAGQAPFPETWVDVQDVTISAPGFIQLTLKDHQPHAFSTQLQKKIQVPQMAMKGNISNIQTKDKDGWIDFAVAFDSMTKKDILNFNVSKVMSPWKETITVAGFEFPVPQNLFLPKQKESFILSVTLQKPWFTLNYDFFGAKYLYALRGRFPLKKVMSELQNKKPYHELVNYFSFSSAGRANFDFLDLNLSPKIDATQMAMDKTLAITGPSLQEGQVTFGISSYKENGFYQPLDIKNISSEETITFKTSSTIPTPHFIAVVKNSTEFDGLSAPTERMSVSMDVAKPNIFVLPLIADPSWTNTNELHITLPTLPTSAYSDLGMMVVISDRQDIKLPNGAIIKYKIPVWEIHLPQWTENIVIPNLNPTTTTSKRVEITLLAKSVDIPGQQNPTTLTSNHEIRLDNTTHFTKSALDY